MGDMIYGKAVVSLYVNVNHDKSKLVTLASKWMVTQDEAKKFVEEWKACNPRIDTRELRCTWIPEEITIF